MAWNARSNSPKLIGIVSALLPVGAALVRELLLGDLGTNSPLVTFYPAVVLAALLAGLPAGVSATALSACLASYFWIEPLGSLRIGSAPQQLDMAVFVVSGIVLSVAVEVTLRTRERAAAEGVRSHLATETGSSLSVLKRERNLLRQVVDAFPSRLFVKDIHAGLHLVNETMAQFHGVGVRDMEGKNIGDFRSVPAELAARLSAEDREVFASRITLHSSLEIPDAGGKLCSFDTLKTPLYNEDGSCDKILVVTTEVTERKQAENALRESRELLDSIISGTPDPIYVKDTNGKYLLVNQAAQEIMGKKANAVLGKDDAEIFPHQEVPAILRGHRAVLESGKVDLFEDAMGRKRVFLSTKGPLHDAQGNLTGIFGIARDVTEQKQAAEEFCRLNEELDRRVAERTAQLEAAIKEQESFSYSVSHDLRSPLRHINSYAAILAEEHGAGLDDDGRELLERICKASSKMGKLIDDLLELARTSRIPLTEEPIDLSRMATICSLMLKQTEKDRRVDFIIADGMQILGDKTLMRLVLENLLNNAWKYTLQEKVALIEVGMEIMNGQEVYFVSDNGAGFDMQYKDKLFGAFQRLHGAEYEGNGIGLATVKRAIERHGGTIWAEGEVGSGATFYFTLGKEALCYPQQLRQNQA